MQIFRYRDEHDNVLYQVTYRRVNGVVQRYFSENPDVRRGLEGFRRVPYRLRELRRAIKRGRTVYIVPSEADADFLLAEFERRQRRECATTLLRYSAHANEASSESLPEGSGNFFHRAYRVIVIEGPDAADKTFAKAVVGMLSGGNTNVRLAHFPGTSDDRSLVHIASRIGFDSFLKLLEKAEQVSLQPT